MHKFAPMIARATRVVAPVRATRAPRALFSSDFGGWEAQRPPTVTWFGEGRGGKKATLHDIPGSEHRTPTSKGVTLAPFCTKDMGDSFGLYAGTIEVDGCIGREIHGQNTETIYVLEGSGEGFINDDTFAMAPGDIMHVEKNQWHGLRNTGGTKMKIIVVGSPDY